MAAEALVTSSRFKLHSVGEVLDWPEPEWLIDGVLEEGGLGLLYGQRGSGKSFLAIDWALSIATGKDWYGATVKRGPVVYIVGEAVGGAGRRLRAWKTHYNVDDIPGAFFVRQAPQFAPGDVTELLSEIERSKVKPSLIVLDTLARSFVGDENTSADMGRFLKECQRLQQQETDAAMLLVHHCGWNADHARGSSSLEAAADAVMRIEQKAGRFVLQNTKQKDADEFHDRTFELQPVAAPNGDKRDSCVLRLVANSTMQAKGLLTEKQQAALTALAECEPATWSQWKAATGMSSDAFGKHRDTLLTKGFVEEVENEAKPYRVTEAGRAQLPATVEKKVA